jgi:hypothetical protein
VCVLRRNVRKIKQQNGIAETCSMQYIHEKFSLILQSENVDRPFSGQKHKLYYNIKIGLKMQRSCTTINGHRNISLVSARGGRKLLSVVQGRRSCHPITGLDSPIGFQQVEAPRFQDNRHMKVVRLSS